MARIRLAFLLPFVAALTACSGSDFTLPASPDLGDGSTDAVADAEGDTPGEDAIGPDAIGPDAAPDDTAPPPDAAPDAPVVDASIPCTKNEECTPNVCVRRGCSGGSPGTCTPVVGAAQFGPVCGCDGVTYWNAITSASRSAPIAHDGPCLDEAKDCIGDTCDTGSGGSGGTCVHAIASETGCITTTDKGQCWLIPTGTICGTSPGPSVRTCAGTCSTECEAIKAKARYYHAACTP